MDWTLERVNGPKNFIVLEKSERSYPCGRNPSNKIICPSLVVSRRHCLFIRTDDVISVIDLGSSNGIFVNGQVQEPTVMVELQENDIIGIGSADEYREGEPMFVYKLHKGNLNSRNLEQFDDLLTQRSSSSSNILSTPNGHEISAPVWNGRAPGLLKRNLPAELKDKETPIVPPKVSKLSNGLHEISDDDVQVAEVNSTKSSKELSAAKETSEVEEIEEIWSTLSSPKISKPKSSITEPGVFDAIEKAGISLSRSNRKTLEVDPENEGRKQARKVELVNGETELSTSFKQAKKKESPKEPKKTEDVYISPKKTEPITKKSTNLINSDENSHKTIRFSLDSSSSATRLTGDILQTDKNSGAKESEKVRDRSDSEDSLKPKKAQKNRNGDTEAGKKSSKVSDGDKKAKESFTQAGESESERLSFLSKQPVATSSPLKLKPVKQEPMTSFSLFDTVDLSDDDDDIFPSSQLFDSNIDGVSTKEEDDCHPTKAEAVFEDEEEEEEAESKNFFTRVEAAIQDSEEIITLSDSDDEENPWLHKLSESQRIKEEEPEISAPLSPKMEFVDEILDLKKSFEYVEEKWDFEGFKDEKCDSNSDSKSSVKSPRSMTLAEIEKDINGAESDESDSNIFQTSTPSTSKERKKSLDKSSDDSLRSKQGTPKGPKIIEPLRLPQRKRQSLTDPLASNDAADSASLSTSKSHIGVKDFSIRVRKLPLNLTSKEKRELQLQARIKQKKYENEQRIRRIMNKWTQNVPLPLGKRTVSPITKKQKLKIVNERKEKLKALATKEKQNSVKKPVQRVAVKAKAKVSTKNRGDFLINEQITATNKAAVNVAEPSTSKSKAKSPKETSKNSEKKSKWTIPKKTKTDEAAVKPNDSKQKSKSKPPSMKDKKLSERRSKSVEKSEDRLATSVEDKTIQSLKDLSLNQKENRVPNNSLGEKDNQTKNKTKKKVSFSEDLVTVRVYEIEHNNTMRKCPGKDALIPQDKMARARKINKSQHPKLEEFLMYIFNWNPSWLEEQKNLQSEPPIVNNESLIPLLTNYKSYNDYYQILMPLLLLELWHGITKEFESIDRNNRRLTVFCSIVNNSVTFEPIPSTNKFMTTMLLEVLASEEDIRKQVHPIYGDLVFLELCYKNEEGKQNFMKVFAYVKHLHRTPITPNTFFNRDLMNYTTNPSKVLTYTVLTRPLQVDLCINRVLRLRCVTYLRANMRMVQALQFLPCSPLLDAIIDPKAEQYHLPCPTKQQSLLFTGDDLNPKQMEAVFKITEVAVRKEPKVCLIQGPPGTGKSEVIVNMVMQILYGANRYKNKENTLRILLCAPSNAAIDEIVLRLLDRRAKLPNDRFKMVRVGLLGPMHPRVREISVEELAKRDVKRTINSYQTCGQSMNSVEEEKRFLEAGINALQSKLNSTQQSNENQIELTRAKLLGVRMRYDLLNNSTQSYGNNIDPRDLNKLHRGAENKILIGADIIACTLSSCYTNIMESAFGGSHKNISVCIVDEATQSCEAETLIPLMLGVNTLVLVGDPAQLPATVISQRAKKLGLDQSLFSRTQRAFDGHKNSPVIMLDVQYRMDYHISYWPNKYFYNSKLKNGIIREQPMLPFHPYRVLNLNSYQNPDKFSNTQEADFVANLIYSMINHLDVKRIGHSVSIGIITPYRNQQTLVQRKINQRLSPILDNLKVKINTEVNTVDSFQGHERDIIIMSCVRTNGIGFLSDPQRLCVALTRAKHCLILCGNFATFQRDTMWRALLSDAQSRKNYIDMKADSNPDDILLRLVR